MNKTSRSRRTLLQRLADCKSAAQAILTAAFPSLAHAFFVALNALAALAEHPVAQKLPALLPPNA
jgi:hypothetical protein